MVDIYFKTMRQIFYIYASDDSVVRSVESGVSMLVISYEKDVFF